MSFGSETGRARFGSKGSSNKAKKLKRKKDEFRAHKKLHIQESAPVDLGQVKARTILALDRLGHQVLSSEPGGYDLQSWMRSLDSLLDDFQEKVGPGRLPADFDARRREVSAPLLAPTDSSAIDSEVRRLIQEQEEAKRVVEEEVGKTAARLRSLQEERGTVERDLKEERKKLAEMNEAKQSRQFLSRFLRPAPSTAQTEAAITELESNLRRIEEETERLQKARAAGTGSSAEADAAIAEARQKSVSLQARLDELGATRRAKVQLTQEREVAAKYMSELVSRVEVTPRSKEP